MISLLFRLAGFGVMLMFFVAADAAGPAPDGSAKDATVMATASETVVYEGQVLPVRIETRTLPNGLKVSFVPFDSPGLAAYFTAMRVGSRDEVEAGHSGFAHLFEHMMFRGTKSLPGNVYDEAVQSLGADSTAWTWNDQTVYQFVAPTASLPKVIEMEADRFQNLWYEEPEFKTESGAVLGEYNKNFSDPVNQMEEDLMNLAFDKSTYKHTTMGFLTDIKAMPTMYEYSREFFRRHYVPSKALLFVAGDLQPDTLWTAIAKQYGPWNRPGEDLPMPVEPEQTKERRFHRAWKNPVLPQLLVGYKVPRYDNQKVDYAALTVLGELLFGKTGPLYRKLVLDRQLAEAVRFWDWPHRDASVWICEARLKEPAFDVFLTELQTALQQVRDGQVSAERLQAVKSHYRYRNVLQLDNPGEVAQQLSLYATLDGDPASLDRFLQRVAEVTLDDLRRVAGSYLTDGRRTVVTLAYETGKGAQP